MKTLRTRFAKDIVAEFLPPLKSSKKVIIFLSGMPSIPRLTETLNFYSKKNFWVFHPRYRGSWESDGTFLKFSPEKDVLDIIKQLSKGFVDLGSNKKYSVPFNKLYLFGCSFGGPAALLASRDKRVSKIVALSPVIDWCTEGKTTEPLPWLFQYIKKAYGQGYRLTYKNWNKLELGNFYNPQNHKKEIDGKKVLIFHAKDDKVVNINPAFDFCKTTGSRMILLKKGGHLSSSLFSDQKFYKEIKKFLSK